MDEQAKPKRICPYLGFANDPHSRFAYPDPAHRCFSTGQGTTVPTEHQTAFCMSQRYGSCPRFVDLPAVAADSQPITTIDGPVSTKKAPFWQIALLGIGGLIVGLLIILGIFFISPISPQVEGPEVSNNNPQSGLIPSPVATATLALTATLEPENTPTPVAVAVADTPTPTTTSDDFETIEVTSAAGDIGWLTNAEERGNHFGDSYMYAGIFNGQIYNGAFLFDLSSIPRGAPIEYAAIEMTGLRDDRLAIRNDESDAAGVWTLRMLSDEFDPDWRRQSFQDNFNITALQVMSPILGSQNLAAEQTNIFEFTPGQIRILENRIIDEVEPTISFRIEGPLIGPDNLFAWDTGYGPQSEGNRVRLVLRVGPPPTVPPPYDYVLVTSTPTPESIMTAAAIALQLTADATRIGTVTPLPPNAVTPTPYPDYLVLVDTPTPENQETVEFLQQMATAVALTTGTPTAIPTNAVTATPTPTETATPTPTPPSYVLITSTPTPETVFAAATQSVRATALALQIGTATPLPSTWVTPVVVTATPTPLNGGTAQAIADLATAVALTTGTPTATPPNMVTATSTPVFEAIALILSPTPVTPTPDIPDSMPAGLLGKILFRSDREAEEGGEFVYVYDPATGELGRLTADWPYAMATARDEYSADTVFRAYVKQLLWTNDVQEITARATVTPNAQGTVEVDENNEPVQIEQVVDRIYTPTEEYAIHRYDYKYGQEDILTRAGTGITFDPAWSPVSNEIAYVSTETQNDEIWVINHDGTNAHQLTKNEWEWDHSPSWSPDGKQIVFASNRTGNQQLWVMNADGSDQKLLMGWDNWTPYNDWDPVWVKYLDPVPPEDQPR